MNIDFPFHFDGRGRTATTNDNDHIRDMIEQFLFTNDDACLRAAQELVARKAH